MRALKIHVQLLVLVEGATDLKGVTLMTRTVPSLRPSRIFTTMSSTVIRLLSTRRVCIWLLMAMRLRKGGGRETRKPHLISKDFTHVEVRNLVRD